MGLLLSAVLAVMPRPSRATTCWSTAAPSAGVTAAVQTARMGKSVLLVEPGKHLGGLTSGGLGMTDSGDTRAIGGVSREFYQRLKRHYDTPAAWTREKPDAPGSYHPASDAIWRFEPHVAEQVFRQMLDEAKVPVVLGERLDLRPGVERLHPDVQRQRNSAGREP